MDLQWWITAIGIPVVGGLIWLRFRDREDMDKGFRALKDDLAVLDAVFFYLYGLDQEDAAYIMDSFPIVREQDTKAFGRYRTQDDILAVLGLF